MEWWPSWTANLISSSSWKWGNHANAPLSTQRGQENPQGGQSMWTRNGNGKNERKRKGKAIHLPKSSGKTPHRVSVGSVSLYYLALRLHHNVRAEEHWIKNSARQRIQFKCHMYVGCSNLWVDECSDFMLTQICDSRLTVTIHFNKFKQLRPWCKNKVRLEFVSVVQTACQRELYRKALAGKHLSVASML